MTITATLLMVKVVFVLARLIAAANAKNDETITTAQPTAAPASMPMPGPATG